MKMMMMIRRDHGLHHVHLLRHQQRRELHLGLDVQDDPECQVYPDGLDVLVYLVCLVFPDVEWERGTDGDGDGDVAQDRDEDEDRLHLVHDFPPFLVVRSYLEIQVVLVDLELLVPRLIHVPLVDLDLLVVPSVQFFRADLEVLEDPYILDILAVLAIL